MIAMWVRHLSGGLVHVLAEPAGNTPEQHLRPFRGILQADAFTGYDRLFSAERKVVHWPEVACWAHAQRKIHDVYISSKSATAVEALEAKSVNCIRHRGMKCGDYRSQSVLPSGSSEARVLPDVAA